VAAYKSGTRSPGDIQQALDALNKYLQEHNGSGDSNLEDWTISDFQDALLFSAPAPSRSNYLYLVKESKVVGFAPSTTSFDEACALI
jgi:hypothetical protein